MTATPKRAAAVALALTALAALPATGTAATCPSCTSDGPITVDPGPVDPGPVDPGPVDPGPVDPGPGDTFDGVSPGSPIIIGDDSQNFAPAPLPTLTPVPLHISEGDAGTHDAPLVVQLGAPAKKGVSFDWHTQDLPGGAVAGADYVAAGGHVDVPKGDTTVRLSLPVIGDGLYEGHDEAFGISITNVHGAHLAGQGVAFIVDDDARPRLTIDDTRAAESAGAARFRVWLSGPSAGPVDVAWTTADHAAAGLVRFAPGETEKQIVVPVADDHAHGPDKTLAVTASVTGDVEVVRGYGFGTIVDDDPAAPAGPGPIAGRPAASANGAHSAAPIQPLTLTATRHGLRLRLLCPRGPGACRGTVKLTAGTLVAGVQSVSIDSGQSEVVTVPLSRTVRRRLARRHRLTLVAHSVLRRHDGVITRLDSRFTVRPGDAT